MTILHYFLGFPPYRTGGLTKYCIDLAKTQMDSGHDVYFLWPGHQSIFNKTERIKKRIRGIFCSYELINPLPVSLLNGINDDKLFTKYISKNGFDNLNKFLTTLKPDIIHIHTLMGMYKEFFELSKSLNIKLIFTTHDYFGLCPRVNFVFKSLPCIEKVSCKNCQVCNEKALSKNQIQFLQSRFYRFIKNSPIIKFVKIIYRNTKIKIDSNTFKISNKLKINDYINLRNYYLSILSIFDHIHFNSTIAKRMYDKFISFKNYSLLPLTHNNVSTKFTLLKEGQKNNFITFAFIGSFLPYKGFPYLLNVFDRIFSSGRKNFKLVTFSEESIIRPFIDCKKPYRYNEIESLMANVDVLIFPSIAEETFGFVALEAISLGIPVISNNNNGIVDLLSVDNLPKLIYKSENELIGILDNMLNDMDLVYSYKNQIRKYFRHISMPEHTSKIIDIYKGIL
jgi:glycosyltransferase involved in cell wall biosynthesis